MSTWTVVIGLFCYFFFMWGFRFLFVMAVAKAAGSAKRQVMEKLKGDAENV